MNIRALTRPAKVRNAVERRYFERTLNRMPVSGRGQPMDFGTSYGGWMIPTAVVQSGWTCYGIGAGGDVSYDLELVRRYQARLRIVEPVEEFVEQARAATGGVDDVIVCHAALASADGTLRMQRTSHPGSRSVSASGLYDGSGYIDVPSRSLRSLMAENGDETIDLLKLDVEGSEYELLEQLDLPGLGVKVFAMQVHHNQPARDARRLVDHLARSGYELVARRPTIKLTFVRRDLL